MAINVETSSVAGSELSYVVQGMEIRLALKDMMNDDMIRLEHTFSRLVFPRVGLALDLDSLAQKLGNIKREFRTDRAINDALEDAEGFTMPAEVLHRHIDKYREQNSSLVDMLRSSVAVHKLGRFHRERCDIAFADDVKYDRLIQLATLGVVIDTPANLVRGLPQDPPRRLTKRLQTVYSKASYEVWRKGQGVILQRDQLSSQDQSLLKDNHPHFQLKYF